MKNLKIFEEFLNEKDKYEAFVDRIKKMPEEEKEFVSNVWMDSDEITSTIASSLWSSYRTGSSFKENALKFLAKKGLTVGAEKALDDFIEKNS